MIKNLILLSFPRLIYSKTAVLTQRSGARSAELWNAILQRLTASAFRLSFKMPLSQRVQTTTAAGIALTLQMRSCRNTPTG